MRLLRFSSRHWVTPVIGQPPRLWSRLPTRVHALIGEVAKFGTIGIINIFVNLGVFNLLLHAMPGGAVKAKAIAAIIATTSAYFMNRYWTYRHAPKSTLRREYSLFFLFNSVGFVIETGLQAMAKYWFGVAGGVALNAVAILGIVLGTVFRFWAYRTHVFKVASTPVAATADPLAPAAADAPARVSPAPDAPDAPAPGAYALTPAAMIEDLDSPAPVSPAPALAAESLLDPTSIEAELTDLEFDQVVDTDSLRRTRRP